MDTSQDLLIVGGGLNGSVLALAAAQAGLSACVIDARPAAKGTNFDGRAYALSLSSARLLNAIGIWETVADNAQPMLEIKVSDAQPGQAPSPLVTEFHHAEIEDGPMGHMLEDRYLRTALEAALTEAPNVTLLRGHQVVAQDTSGPVATVTLDDGRQICGQVIAGCDGRGSDTGTRAHISRTEWQYGQTAITAPIAHEADHNGIAHQQFLPAGPLAILPLPGRVSSIVWSEKTARANALMAMDDAAFLDALRPVFGTFLGDISLAAPRFAYPLGLSLANDFVATRFALVGDAAHGMHPIAGQGLNAGLRDVAALIDVLIEARGRGEELGSDAVLERYQRWRRFASVSLVAATDIVNRIFSNDNPGLRGMRDLGLGLVGKVPGLRRAFIREAAGLSGDLPSLMR